MPAPANAQYLENIDGVTFEELSDRINEGARFVVYQYAISLLAVTLRRVSDIYYIPAGTPATAFKGTANALSLIMGWWSIPWGPMRTIQSLKVNNKGGIDVTADVTLNLTKEGFEQHWVVIAAIETFYGKPNKIETEEITKALTEFLKSNEEIPEIYFGMYINTNDPFFVIGLPGKYTLPHYTNELKQVLDKYFRKNTHYEYIDIADGTDTSTKLIQLGLRVTHTK